MVDITPIKPMILTVTIKTQFRETDNFSGVVFPDEISAKLKLEDGKIVFLTFEHNGDVRITQQIPDFQPAIRDVEGVRDEDVLNVSKDDVPLPRKRPTFEEMMSFAEEGMKKYDNALRELAK